MGIASDMLAYHVNNKKEEHVSIRDAIIARVELDARSPTRIALDLSIHPNSMHRLLAGKEVQMTTVETIAAGLGLEAVEKKTPATEEADG